MLVDRVERLHVYKWNRKPAKVKVLSTLLYYFGLSYRVVALALRGESRFSYESVRLWYRRLQVALPKPTPKRRSILAIDETKLKLAGDQLYLWAAIDVYDKEVLAVRISWQRNSIDAELFLQDVLRTCTNKPLILVDKGPWYPYALNQMGLKYRHVTFGLRNRIERWFGYLKERTERFHNNFPYHSTPQSIDTYLHSFIGWYHILKT